MMPRPTVAGPHRCVHASPAADRIRRVGEHDERTGGVAEEGEPRCGERMRSGRIIAARKNGLMGDLSFEKSFRLGSPIL
jgi:hypothetical protein